MKIPKLQLVLADKFPSAEVLHGLNPDEVIAIGAAKQASLLGRSRGSNIPSSVEVSALSKPLYIKVKCTISTKWYVIQSYILRLEKPFIILPNA